MELKWVEEDPEQSLERPIQRDCHSCVKWGGGIVVYGGHSYEGAVPQLGDVWRFSLASGWVGVGVGGIEREGHTAVVGDDKMVVFGGMSSAGEPYANTARMDFETGAWDEDCGEPLVPPRFYHTAAHYKGIMYIFGGCDCDAEFGDLWAYDITSRSWSQPTTTGTPPSPRYCHSSCVLGDGLIIFGGCQDATNYNDTYRLDLITFEWIELTPTPQTQPPMPRYGMALTTDPSNHLLYIFGGQDDHQRYNDLYACRVDNIEKTVSWAIIPVSMPPDNRTGHSLKLGDGGALYLYGGNSDEGKELPNGVLKLILPVDISKKVGIWVGDESAEESCEEEEEDDESTEDKPWLGEDAMAGEVDFASLKARLDHIPSKTDDPNDTNDTNPNESIATTCTSIGTSTDWAPEASSYTRKSTIQYPDATASPMLTATATTTINSTMATAISGGGEGKKTPCAVQSALCDLESSVKRKTVMMHNRIQENADLWKVETTTLKNRLSEVHLACDDGLSSMSRRIDRLEETVGRSVGNLQDQMTILMKQMERLTEMVAGGTGSPLGSPGLR